MALAGYKLRINGGALVNQITDVGNVLTHDFTGLASATPYAVEVASYDNAVPPNQSAWSTPITVSTDTPIVPIALIASTSATGNGVHVSLTGAINTAGSSLLVMAVAGLFGSTPVPTDSKGNTWTALTTYHGGTGGGITLFYAANPAVGAGHTFGCSIVQYHSIYVAAFSNVATITPFNVENGAGNASAITQQPGSIMPSQANCVVITALEFNAPSGGVASIDSGFTAIGSQIDGVNFAVSLAYKVQTTAAAVNPTWTAPGAADRMAAAIASFKNG